MQALHYIRLNFFRVSVLFVVSILLNITHGWAQDKIISRKQFFQDTGVLHINFRTDMKKLSKQRDKPALQPASITLKGIKGTDVTDSVKVKLRGKYRRENCGIAALMIDFRQNSPESPLRNLKEMKWVAPCKKLPSDEQLIIREYLVYKMYQLFTEKSFRVRMMEVVFEDEKQKVPTYKQYAFAIEHIDDLAKRNACTEVKEVKTLTEMTNRRHTTMVMMFQYMIGNTDFSIPTYHNIKLIVPEGSEGTRPFVIPYDFDYSGAVNASYAIPHESLGIANVTERYYMGFHRDLWEIEAAAEEFKQKKQAIFNLVESEPLLKPIYKEEIKGFLNAFYLILSDEKEMQKIFVDDVRKQ